MENRGVQKGTPMTRDCRDCGGKWVFYYRKAMDLIHDGNVMNFKVCSVCAERNWRNEVRSRGRYLH